jgi:rubrerythrin
MPERVHPELAAVEVHGMTRSSFILRGALAGASVYGLSSIAPFVGRALAQVGVSDAGVLDFALTLEALEASFYTQALARLPNMRSELKSVTKVLSNDENNHVQTIKDTLNQLAVRPSAPPVLDFGNSLSSEASYLALSQTFEDTGVQAYNGVAPLIRDPRLLDTVGGIVQVEARHAAVIRDLRGQPIASSAFDRPASMEDVNTRVAPYIKNR